MIRLIDTTVFLLVVLTVYAITPHRQSTTATNLIDKRELWVNNSDENNNTLHDQYFPNSQLVLDMATISHAVYRFKWNKFKSCHDINSSESLHNETYPIRLPTHTECMYYTHDESLGTQVLVLRSSVYNYISVAYAGTDDWKTALADGDILMSEFGPSSLNNIKNMTSEEKQKEDDIRSLFNNVPTDVRVHRGFNNNVFANSSEFVKLLNCIESARLGGDCENTSPDNINNSIKSDQLTAQYELITTGHSLGAASSVLLGAALHLLYPTETIRTINYGCPKIGNAEWGSYIDSRQPIQQKEGSGSLEIFRFVNKIDLVPRLPELPLLVHVGHTLQMSVGGVIRVSVSCFDYLSTVFTCLYTYKYFFDTIIGIL